MPLRHLREKAIFAEQFEIVVFGNPVKIGQLGGQYIL